MTAHFETGSGWRQRWTRLVAKVEVVQTAQAEEKLLAHLSQPNKPFVLAFVNAHAMNSVAVSEKFFNAVMSADVLLRDGIGMSILLRLLKLPPGRNLNGTDLIPKILGKFAGRPLALFGTRDPYLMQAQEAVVADIAPTSPCLTADGFLDTPTYIHLAAANRPCVIVLGMGMPRQEDVAVGLRVALGYPCLIICGGAIIDFLGKKTPRAPLWMRSTGLEWLFRLALEPKRMFIRYVIGNPLFMARALILAFNARGRPPAQQAEP